MTTLRTSASHVLSDERWLDVHSAACAPEYEAFVRAVDFEPGSFIVDLGSGAGSFEPWLLEAIGAGRIVCVDIAVENCRLSLQRLPSRGGSALQAGLTALPFSTATFDGAWCANTLQYLDDTEALEALADLRRIVRPGGIVAVKDVDMTAFKVAPASPFLASHLAEACLLASDSPPESSGSLRGRELRLLMLAAGFQEVRQQAVLIERWAPLAPPETDLWSGWLTYLAGLAAGLDLPIADQLEWQQIARDGGRTFVNRPDFYGCEAQVLAVGRVPS